MKKEKKPSKGFGLRLAFAIIFIIATIGLLAASFAMLANEYRGYSFKEYLCDIYESYGSGVVDFDGDGNFDYSWRSKCELLCKDGKLYIERKEYNEQLNDTEYVYYDFVSEDMQGKTFTFKERKTGELTVFNFEQFQRYSGFVWDNGWVSYGGKSMFIVFLALGLVFGALGLSEFLCAFLGKKYRWANKLSVAIGIIAAPTIFGIMAYLGGVRGCAAIERNNPQKYAVKKRKNGFALRIVYSAIFILFAVGYLIGMYTCVSGIISAAELAATALAPSIVIGVIGVFLLICAIVGRTHKWADVVHIIFGAITYPGLIGFFSLAGGMQGFACADAIAEENRKKAEELAASEVGTSTFTGGAFANYFISLGTAVLSALTLGIAYPFMACVKLRWRASHTFVDGRQLKFDGKGMQFFGRYMLMWLLSVITFGIYYVLCMKVAITKWETKHTHYADTQTVESEDGGEGEGNRSVFDGNCWQLLGVNLLCNFVTVITLSFGYYWAHCYRERWFCKHKTIDGDKLYFDGKALQYFGQRIKWTFLTAITLGIYGFWLKVKSEKWTASHTHVMTESVAVGGGSAGKVAVDG